MRGRSLCITLNVFEKVKDYLKQTRWYLHFSSFDILRLAAARLLAPVKRVFSSRPNTHIYTPYEKKQALLKIGQEKVIKELDCVSFLHRMRKLELLFHLLLNSKQRFLLSMQKKGYYLSWEKALNQRNQEKMESAGSQSTEGRHQEENVFSDSSDELRSPKHGDNGSAYQEDTHNSRLQRALTVQKANNIQSDGSSDDEKATVNDKLLFGLFTRGLTVSSGRPRSIKERVLGKTVINCLACLIISIRNSLRTIEKTKELTSTKIGKPHLDLTRMIQRTAFLHNTTHFQAKMAILRQTEFLRGTWGVPRKFHLRSLIQPPSPIIPREKLT